MLQFYLIPISSVGNYRGPLYFKWRFGTGIDCRWSMMDYGFLPTALVLAHDITPADDAALVLNADVYAFPTDLDAPVSDPTIDAFFEGIHIPTDWLTPSTSYRELLRQVAGMFQFNQRYAGVSGGASIFSDSTTLDTKLVELTAQERAWLDETSESMGYPKPIGNPSLRALVKRAGSLWGSTEFIMGGATF